MVPVLARLEIPSQVRTEESVVGVRVEVHELKQRLSGGLRVACVVAQHDPNLIVFADSISKISRQRSIVEVMLLLRPVCPEIGARCRINEIPQQAADFGAAATSSECAAFAEQVDFRDSRRPA